jgi:hypothetical protein
LVLADKACYNIVFICKAHYYPCINELSINFTIGNRTCTQATLSKDEILQIHASVLNILKCSTKPLSTLLTKVLTAVKEMLQMYCATVHMPEEGFFPKIKKNYPEKTTKKFKISNLFVKFTASKSMILQHFIRPYHMINKEIDFSAS